MADNIIVNKEDGITYITLTDGDGGNRVSDPMAADLSDIMDAASDDSRAIVLKTSGEDFCLGRAIMGEGPGTLPEAYDMRGKFDVVFHFYDAFRRVQIPVIGAVQGKACGFGCAMAALCDITIASDDSQYQLPETSHGIMPTMAMSSLIDRVPRKAILYLTYSADFIDAQQALSCGLVSHVVPLAELDASVEALVGKIKNIPVPALHAVKDFATHSIGLPLSAAEQYARSLHATINSSSKMRE